MTGIRLYLKDVRRGLPIVIAICSLTAVAQSGSTTLDNMQTAYSGESNAHVRYLAFAKQADSEGYGEVGSIFRAAARAEEIHASNHAAVIKEMGGTPQAKLETPELKTTKENLQAAIKGEVYERDVMYPKFLKTARDDGNKAAMRSLNFAKTAEGEHGKLYARALSDLSTLKGSKSIELLVCPQCGFTTRTGEFEKCPSCFTPKEKFEKVA